MTYKKLTKKNSRLPLGNSYCYVFVILSEVCFLQGTSALEKHTLKLPQKLKTKVRRKSHLCFLISDKLSLYFYMRQPAGTATLRACHITLRARGVSISVRTETDSLHTRDSRQ